jgi:hypothetical protein
MHRCACCVYCSFPQLLNWRFLAVVATFAYFGGKTNASKLDCVVDLTPAALASIMDDRAAEPAATWIVLFDVAWSPKSTLLAAIVARAATTQCASVFV